jgi:hypothetical protein
MRLRKKRFITPLTAPRGDYIKSLKITTTAGLPGVAVFMGSGFNSKLMMPSLSQGKFLSLNHQSSSFCSKVLIKNSLGARASLL